MAQRHDGERREWLVQRLAARAERLRRELVEAETELRRAAGGEPCDRRALFHRIPPLLSEHYGKSFTVGQIADRLGAIHGARLREVVNKLHASGQIERVRRGVYTATAPGGGE